ncbi:MAG: hypothetical protein U0V74_06380 [Chitinophagales bacterium]
MTAAQEAILKKVEAELNEIAEKRHDSIYWSGRYMVKVPKGDYYLSKRGIPDVLEFKQTYLMEIFSGIGMALQAAFLAFIAHSIPGAVFWAMAGSVMLYFSHNRDTVKKVVIDKYALTIDESAYNWKDILELFIVEFSENKRPTKLLAVVQPNGEYNIYDVSSWGFRDMVGYAAAFKKRHSDTAIITHP